MKSILLLILLALPFPPAFAGQALFEPLEDIVKSSDLVRIFEITGTQDVTVDTGSGEGTVVHVATARLEEALKGGGQDQTFALVSSSLPSTSAVWRPLKKGRYIGFLSVRMGHYEFEDIWWLREIREDGKVEWLDRDAEGQWQTTAIELKDARERILKIVKEQQIKALPPGR